MKKLVTTLTLFLALILGVQVDAFSQDAPTVNGLFYGDGDHEKYSLYSTSPNDSKLYINVTDGILYVALVADPDNVNDNVFDQGGRGASDDASNYMIDAGWDEQRSAFQLMNSEFAEFTLEVAGESWTWKQGYAGQIDGEGDIIGPNNANFTNAEGRTWISGLGVAGGDDTDTEVPPAYTAASSMSWNMNNYASSLPNPTWDIGALGSDIDDWKSPFDPNNPDNIPGDYSGFDETYDWEWSMVYEWSVDLNDISDSNSPLFIVSGASHHSPSKDDLSQECEVDDCFPLEGAIGDFVWHDINENGIQDDDEPGIEGVTVNLLDENEDIIKSTTTNSNGFYLFSELQAGNYVIQFEAPEGYEFTEQSVGNNTDIDSDASTNPGKTGTIDLEEGELKLDVDAGLLIIDTTTIEMQGACFRMLSSPVQGTYSQLFRNILTQGENVPADGKEFHIEDGPPNVWVWPNDREGNDPGDWQALTSSYTGGSGLNTQIEPGSGVLLSMFEIQDLDNPPTDPNEVPIIEIDLSEFDENEAPVTYSLNDTDDNSWTLAGNPFFTSIDIEKLYQDNESNINGVIYIYDRGLADDDDRPAGIGGGGWRTYSVGPDYDVVNSAGDIEEGKIHPYQGFFVQYKEGGDAELTFTDNARAAGGEFYGKQKSGRNVMRLELSGEQGKATTWIGFSEKGSFNRISYDAFEMEPMASEYMMLASRKEDGTLFDIGYYPTTTEEFEIPVAVESTIPGRYTITATDFEISLSQDLYFVDRETNTTLPIDESFSYEFTINKGAAKIQSPDVNRCSMEMNQMSKSAGDDRFVITTNASANVDNDLPQDVSLKQNYPNPFNPTTSIQYELPESANVSLEVYNMLGQRVASIAEGQQSAGAHTVDFDASHLTSGVYIYRLTAGSTVINKRMTLVK